MARQRLSTYRAAITERLEAAFSDDHPPKDVALTFAFGTFFAALPNFGLALVLFALLGRYADRVSNLALVAVLVVLNPPVKWAIYAAGFWLGSRLLGPVPGGIAAALSPSTAPEVFLRLVVGTAIVAAGCALAGYLAARRFIRELDRRELRLAETVIELPSE